MPDNEEDYLDQLLKSINEKEAEDSIEELIEKHANMDNEENADETFDMDSFIDDISSEYEEASKEKEIEIESVSNVLSPEEIAELAKENQITEEISEEEKENAADAELDELLDNTDYSEAVEAEITTDDNVELSDSDMERLLNMELDDIIEDVTSDSVSVEELFGFGNSETTEDSSGSDVPDEAGKSVKKEKTKAKDSDKETTKKTDKETASSEDEQEDLNEVEEKKTKKKSIIERIKAVFFDSLDNEEPKKDKTSKKAAKKAKASKAEDVAKDENEQLIDDVFKGKESTDDFEAPKKGFVARFKYRWEQYKAKQAEEERQEEEAEALDEEERKKAREEKKAKAAAKKEEKQKEKENKKKEPKVKKEKPKKEKKPKPEPKPGDILKIKPVSMVMFVLFVAGVIVLITIFNSSFNYDASVSKAKSYYVNGDYVKAFDQLDGRKLRGNDKTLYSQSRLIARVQRQIESYGNYRKMNMNIEALNALIVGVYRYTNDYEEAQELGVEDKTTEKYNEIIQTLEETFKISEKEALNLATLYEKDYTNYYYKIKDYGEAVE